MRNAPPLALLRNTRCGNQKGEDVAGGLGRLQLWGRLSTRRDGTFWNADNPLT